MLTLPLWYLLIPFFVVLLGSAIFAFFNLYHIAQFGMRSLATSMVFSAYLVGYLAIVAFSFSLFAAMNWQDEVGIEEILPYSNEASSRFGL